MLLGAVLRDISDSILHHGKHLVNDIIAGFTIIDGIN